MDKQDRLIISHLEDDGRKSFKEIAEDMKVSVATIHNRYKNLVKENILYVIGWADPEKCGLNNYSRIMVEVKPSKLIQSVAEELMKMNEVSCLALTSGRYSIEMDVFCRDNEHLLEVMHGTINDIEGVQDTAVDVYLDVHSDTDSYISKNKEKVDLDEKDFEIIKHIQEDGRKSFTDIAKEMGASVGMVRNRYNELVEKEVLMLLGWVEPHKKGCDAYARAFVYMNDVKSLPAVVKKLEAVKEVIFVASSTGKHALELSILCRDHAHLQDLRNNVIHSFDGVVGTEITMYLKVLKFARCTLGNQVISGN